MMCFISRGNFNKVTWHNTPYRNIITHTITHGSADYRLQLLVLPASIPFRHNCGPNSTSCLTGLFSSDVFSTDCWTYLASFGVLFPANTTCGCFFSGTALLNSQDTQLSPIKTQCSFSVEARPRTLQRTACGDTASSLRPGCSSPHSRAPTPQTRSTTAALVWVPATKPVAPARASAQTQDSSPGYWEGNSSRLRTSASQHQITL